MTMPARARRIVVVREVSTMLKALWLAIAAALDVQDHDFVKQGHELSEKRPVLVVVNGKGLSMVALVHHIDDSAANTGYGIQGSNDLFKKLPVSGVGNGAVSVSRPLYLSPFSRRPFRVRAMRSL